MNIITRFNQAFGFTKNETRIVLFLTVTFLSGIGIKVYKSYYPTGPADSYASVDSEYYARTTSAESLLRSGTPEFVPGHADRKEKLLNSKVVNVNTATMSELTALPGIGEGLAENIIEFRRSNGKFKSKADLLKVRGIGKKKLERITALIKTGE